MLRVAYVLTVVSVVTVTLIPLQWLAVTLRWPARRRIPVLYHRLLCRVIGVRVRVVGARHERAPLLVVSNHVSWLDISVITSVAPVVFVAKSEVASWPVFGLLAKLQRSVFVDRERRQRTGEVTSEMARRLNEGDPVVLFGEGTSSDGNRVLPFRSALIGAAREALAAGAPAGQVAIQPLSVAYVGLQGLPMGRQHRTIAAWPGDLDLWPHLVEVLRRGGIDAVVSWGEPLAYDAQSDRKAAAKELETRVRRLTAAALRSRIEAKKRA